jgi:hypothetical protein
MERALTQREKDVVVVVPVSGTVVVAATVVKK